MKENKIFFTALLLYIILIPAGAEVLNVCNDCEYTEIQTALLNSSNGDVIQVDAGVYEENLFVDKSVKITGSESSKIIIQPFNWAQPTLSIMVDDVSIEGIALTKGSTALKTTWSNNVTIINCSVNHNHYGFWLDGNEHKISGNDFEDNNIHIFSTNSVSMSIDKNELSGGVTGISLANSGFNNITENSLTDLRTGIQLKTSTDNIIDSNNFNNCSKVIQAVFSGENKFSHNVADGTFLDLQVSSQNIMLKNEVDGLYARDKCSFSNLYVMDNCNLTGIDFHFSLYEPSLSDPDYVILGDAVNMTLTNPTESLAYMEAIIPAEDLEGIDPATTGFYELDNETLTLISAGTLNDSKLMVNATINHSGHYILLGKEEETGSITTGTPEPTETPLDTVTRSIVAVVVVLAAVLFLAYMYRRK